MSQTTERFQLMVIMVTKLDIVFSITCYLKLRNAITVYCVSHLPIKSNWLFERYRTLTSLLDKFSH